MLASSNKPLIEMRARAPSPASRPYLVHSSNRPKLRRWRPLAIAIAAAILITVVVVFIRIWPFTQRAVTGNLGEAISGTVEVRNFRRTYFPPGAVAEGVVVRHGRDPKTPPLITIEKLTIQASYAGILRQHVSLLRAEGMHGVVPLGEPLSVHAGNTVIDEFQADAALLDFIHPAQP